jgi:hypothetical protein
MIISKHQTSQDAWEWINEFLITQEIEVIKNGGIRSGPQVISHDHFMEINQSWVNPNFDFGYLFGYKKQKWSLLKKNYVDMNILDLVRSEVLEKEAKNSATYNIAFKFSNTHSSGHGCLLSLVFQKRISSDNPIVIINIRSSEVTKRLIFDFLLVQRISEYIYGTKRSISLKLYCGNMFTTAENFVMYNNYKNLSTIVDPKHSEMERRVMEIFRKFSDPQALTNIKYKVHLRAAKRVQLVNTPALKAKDCLLEN